MRYRLLALLAVLAFWTVSLAGLDRFPPIHNDEPTILEPGYRLFSRGVYGLTMYTGFHGEERIYLEVMPLMSWLQGLGAAAFGVGVWPMRFAPSALGALTLALSFSIARRLAGRAVALLTLFLLLFWQWAPPLANPFLGSGIPLIDISRIARYDILVAPLGLGALWLSMRARETRRLRDDWGSGLFAGLAGLTTIYGAFWAAALIAGRLGQPARSIKSIGSFVLGAGSLWLTWGAVIVSNWNDFAGQFAKHAYDGRLNFFDPAFYLDNLVHEIQRYSLGLRDPVNYTRAGLWCLLIGVPLAWLWLARRAKRGDDRWAIWLLAPGLVIPLLLALLINKKSFYYLATVAPLYALLLAWGLVALWRSPRRLLRIGAAAIVLLLAIQGAFGHAQLQLAAGRTESPSTFFAALSRAVPSSTRIYGPHEYWFAWPDGDYRGFSLAFMLADPFHGYSATFGAALAQIDPEIVVVNPYFLEVLSSADQALPGGSYRDQFWDYLSRHHATLILELPDYAGEPVQVYRLER